MDHSKKVVQLRPNATPEPDGLEEQSCVEWTPVYPEVKQPSAIEKEPSVTLPLQFEKIQRRLQMANNVKQITNDLAEIDGFIATSVVDAQSGMALMTINRSETFNIEVASAANTEVIKAKHSAMKALGLGEERIDDILITLESQYHLIAPSARNPLIFIYLALDKSKSNLAMARHYLSKASGDLDI